MQVLIVQLNTPWATFQKCNCSHHGERSVHFANSVLKVLSYHFLEVSIKN